MCGAVCVRVRVCVLLLFETRSYYVAQAVLKLEFFLSFLSAGIIGIYHHTKLLQVP
jgi:hypothetical protein